MPSSACKKQNIRSVCLPKPGFRRCRFYPFLTPNAPCEGLRRRGAGMCLAISTPAVLPSVGRKTSAPRTCLTPLNTSPAPSPVNASRLSSRAARASLGAGAVRYSFTVTDFHRLPLAGLPAHPSTLYPCRAVLGSSPPGRAKLRVAERSVTGGDVPNRRSLLEPSRFVGSDPYHPVA